MDFYKESKSNKPKMVNAPEGLNQVLFWERWEGFVFWSKFLANFKKI